MCACAVPPGATFSEEIMGTQQTAATTQAGNTTATLTSTPVTAALDVVDPVTLSSQLLVLKQKNAAALPTGPTPVEYRAPVLGRKSPDGSNAEVLDGSNMQPDPKVSTTTSTTEFVSREEYEELLERIAVFNNRSSQKI